MTASWIRSLVASTLVLGLLNSAFAADPPLVATDVKQVDRDYWFQGEYLGSAQNSCGKCEACGLQVVALGKSEFHGLSFRY